MNGERGRAALDRVAPARADERPVDASAPRPRSSRTTDQEQPAVREERACRSGDSPVEPRDERDGRAVLRPQMLFVVGGEEAAAVLAFEHCEKVGDRRLLALAENNRGDVALSQGELRLAAVHFERSLAVMRELGDTANVARALYNVGAVALEESSLERAGACFAESLDLAEAVGDPEDVAWCVIGIAALAREQDRLHDAAVLLRGIDAMLAAIGAAMKPNEQRPYSRTRAALAAASVAAARFSPRQT